jgi:L-arabinonolactonase
MEEVTRVFAAKDELGEGPLWDVQEQRLYWLDIELGCYHRLDPATGEHEKVQVGEKVGVMALRENGGMVLASDKGFSFWDPGSRKLEPIGDPERDKPETQFNDGAVDRRGRFWAGTLGDTNHNSLYRLDPGGSITRMETGVDISNGIGWSPDNKTMYFTDSTPAVIYAYDFDLESGSIANRRIFVDSSDRPGVPDGLTVDAEGFVWSARWDGYCVDRYDQDGKLERSIRVPAQCPTSVMFGGPDLDVLYVTSALLEIPPEERARREMDGDLLAIYTGFRGIAEPRFKG